MYRRKSFQGVFWPWEMICPDEMRGDRSLSSGFVKSLPMMTTCINMSCLR